MATMNSSSGTGTLSPAESHKILSRLAFALTAFRDAFGYDPEMQQVLLFLVIATSFEALSVQDAGKQVGITKAASSRNIYLMGEGFKDADGLGLIKTAVDPMDYRRKVVTLTPKGEALAGLVAYRLQEKNHAEA